MERESLYLVSEQPLSWWKLTISKTGIGKASALRGCWQFFASLFSNRLKFALQRRVQELVASLDPSNQENKILIEKITRLVYSQHSWMFGAVKGLQNPPSARLFSGGWMESLIQPYEKRGRYYNFPGEPIWRRFIETLFLLFPGALKVPTDKDLNAWNRAEWQPCARSTAAKITWLGHSGVLLQAKNINLLFDPTFDFVKPCFVRHTKPPIPFEKLPLIDLVVISHSHADHFDPATLKKLMPYKTAAFVPHRLDNWFKKVGFENVEGKKWWQRSIVQRNEGPITLTAIPAQHTSQRTLTDLNQCLWMGAMIEVDGYRIYFAGDTGYNAKILQEIKRQFGRIDLALLPIAPVEGKCELHCDIRKALDAFEKLEAKRMVPIHYGAYRTGTEKIEDPLDELTMIAKQRGILDKISFLKLGETLEMEKIEV